MTKLNGIFSMWMTKCNGTIPKWMTSNGTVPKWTIIVMGLFLSEWLNAMRQLLS